MEQLILYVPRNIPYLAVIVCYVSPFCVRARLAVGLKNIKHEVVFMANDEKITTKLVGKKVAPVLQMTADDLIMNEVR